MKSQQNRIELVTRPDTHRLFVVCGVNVFVWIWPSPPVFSEDVGRVVAVVTTIAPRVLVSFFIILVIVFINLNIRALLVVSL